MRKSTKLGYCTTCNAKILIFDTNGVPFKRKDNYCELLVDLSNDTQMRLAFCQKCVDQGFDADEAIQNLIDGVTHDTKQKNWSLDFKEKFLENYKDLKILRVARAVRLKGRGLVALRDDVLEEVQKIGNVTGLFQGDVHANRS